jgi:pimeloyl-ACP methyl ester carboxylesterase
VGEPIVLIPGFLVSVGRWLASGYVDEFARTHRVIALDPLWHGRSDKPHDAEAYRLDGVAAGVVAVLVAEGIARLARPARVRCSANVASCSGHG